MRDNAFKAYKKYHVDLCSITIKQVLFNCQESALVMNSHTIYIYPFAQFMC